MSSEEVIYIDGDPDWNKPRTALVICLFLAVIFAIRALAAFDSTLQLSIYGVLILLVITVGVYIYHMYAHSRVKISGEEIEVAVSIFRRKPFERDKIKSVDQIDNVLQLDLKNGNRIKAALTFFSPEALGRINASLKKHGYT